MLPDKTFEGRTGIITGGATGIGFAIAREITRLGGRVVIASRKEENLKKAVEKLGGGAEYRIVDVRDAAAVQAMVDSVERIDFLVNNAAGNFIAPSDQLTVNGWNSVIGIVLNGTFYCSSAVGKKPFRSAFSVNRSGSDRVDPDLVPRPLHRECARHRENTGFRAGGVHDARRAGPRVVGDDVQHHAAALRRDPLFPNRARTIERAVEDDADHGVPSVDRQLI